MYCIGYSETFHPIGMSPLLEMPFERSPTPVTIIPADLTFIFYPKSMQLVQPIWNRLPIPAQRQILRVIRLLFVLRVRHLFILDVIVVLLFFVLQLSPGLLFPDLVHSVLYNIAQLISHKTHIKFLVG